jgi:hypothetical protein
VSADKMFWTFNKPVKLIPYTFHNHDFTTRTDLTFSCRGIYSVPGGHSIGHSKQKEVYMRPIPNGFGDAVPKLLIRKRYYVLFLIPVFNVQVTKLVHFT